MNIANVTAVLERAAVLLDSEHEEGIGWCQGGYCINGSLSQGLGATLEAGLVGLDVLGAIHRAAYELDLVADEADTRAALAAYLGYERREDTPGTVIRDWNDQSGRTEAQAKELLEQFAVYLNA